MVQRLKLTAPLQNALILCVGLALLASCDSAARQNASSSSSDSAAIWLSPDRPTILSAEPAFGLADQSVSAEPAADDSLATMELPVGAVCGGIAYRNGKGKQVTGTRTCPPKACEQSGEANCVTVDDYPAVDKKAIKANQMTDNITIAGVTGTYNTSAYKDCTVTNQSDCTSNATFLPIETSILTPGNIKAGKKLSDTFTGAYPSAAHHLKGAPTTGAVAFNGAAHTEVLTATKTGYFWLSSGKVQTATGDNRLHANNLLLNHKAYGVTGNATKTLPPACIKDNDVSCTVTAPWLAVKPADLNAAHIKKGVTIGGVTGIYPSDAAPLASAATNIADLDLQTNYNQLSSATNFEYFDREGNQYKLAGEPTLNAANLKAGETVLGVTGTLLEADKDSLTTFDHSHEINHEGKEGQLHGWSWCYNKGDCTTKYWRDVTPLADANNKPCSTNSKTCVFRNLLQELDWAFALDAAKRDWQSAGEYCRDLELYGKTNWRLANQKEALQAAANGMINLQLFDASYFQGTAPPVRFWTATMATLAAGESTRVVYAADKDMFVEDNGKVNGSITHNLACVRDLEPAEAAAAKRAQ